jgi:hypothetical protein
MSYKNKEDEKYYHAELYKKKRDEILARNKAWYEANKEKRLARIKEYQEENREHRASWLKDWHEKTKEYRKVKRAKWRKDNPAKVRAYTANYRASKKCAIPFWADLDKITEFYLKCPDGHEVDHIVPLRGKEVCGLHTLENLQYLPTLENRSKGNKLDGKYLSTIN